MDTITIILLLLLLFFVLMYFITRKQLKKLEGIYAELDFKHRSIQVKHGKAWEDFVPFMPEFEKIANKDNFVFIGMPIDGIAFDDNAVKFIEIKTGKSQLSQKQRNVRDLVKDKKVEWHELRFDHQ